MTPVTGTAAEAPDPAGNRNAFKPAAVKGEIPADSTVELSLANGALTFNVQ